MVNYQNGQIYIIKCNTTNLVYIGSTAQEKLSVRIGGHKRQYKNYCNGKTNYYCSFKIIKNDNYTYETLEFYKCDCRKELEERERFYIEDYKNKYGDKLVNKYIPTRTKKEYRNDKKDIIKKQRAEYYKNNREDFLTKQKERYINNREELLKNQKEYYINHKKERAKYNKEYYKKNK